MNQCLILALAGAVLFAGCKSSSEAARGCATDIGVGEVQPFAMPMPSGTEGITFDAEGNLFVSAQIDDGDDQVLAVMEDGTFDVAAEAASILGLASHPNGIIGAGIGTGNLLLIDPVTGTTEIIATDLGEPNFVVTTPWDTILVSDDTSPGANRITEVTWDGDVSVWVEGVPTPNGMVFSLDKRTLYVASTFQDVGLWRVPVSEDGQAGEPAKWVDFDPGTTPDGVAIDSEGNVYVALNIVAEIARVAPDGSVTLIAEGVAFAASLAFGQGEFDPCSIYATNLAGTQLWRVGIGVLGVEQ